jgi:acetyl/propionyl-CoA carboxylase alpha subunit
MVSIDGDNMNKKMLINGEEVLLEDIHFSENTVSFKMNSKTYEFSKRPNGVMVNSDNQSKRIDRFNNEICVDGVNFCIEGKSKSKSKKSKSGNSSMLSPMPGKVIDILVKKDAVVKAGDVLVIMEAMKMEHSIKASSDGVIKNVFVQIDQLIGDGVELVKLIPNSGEGDSQ